MENLMLPTQLPHIKTEEGHILYEALQILNHICGAPTIIRQTLATDMMRVVTKCLKALADQKKKNSSLEEELKYLREKVANDNKRPTDSEDSSTEGVRKRQWNHLIGETIFNSSTEYKLGAILGQGEFGVVAKCWKMPENKHVALKMIKDKDNMKLARHEVDIMDYLRDMGSEHFNVVTNTTSFVWDDHFCMEFELMDTSLGTFIEESVCLTPDKIRPILHQVAIGLYFLKNAGVVHTDLKPDNIMLVDRREKGLKIKIIDLGLAIWEPEKHTGEAFQPLAYRAPEVLLGAPFNHAIDMWAFGCIIAEMLLGSLLFYPNDKKELMELIVHLLGMPPDELFDCGFHTEKYAFERTSGEQPLGWTLKCSGERGHGMSSIGGKEHAVRRLFYLLKSLQKHSAVSTEDQEAFECDLLYLIDLLVKMLDVDPNKRISPEDIVLHPFITMKHLDWINNSNYFKSSFMTMKACFSSTPSRTSSTHETNGEEEQEVFTRGAKTSTNEKQEFWDDSLSLNRSPQKCCSSLKLFMEEEKQKNQKKQAKRRRRRAERNEEEEEGEKGEEQEKREQKGGGGGGEKVVIGSTGWGAGEEREKRRRKREKRRRREKKKEEEEELRGQATQSHSNMCHRNRGESRGRAKKRGQKERRSRGEKQ